MLIAGIAAATVTLTDVVGQAGRKQAKSEGNSPVKRSGKLALKPGQIDLEKSRVYVHVGKKRFGHAHAIEGKIKSGSINVNGDKAVGEIVFDMASFTADTDEARKQVELKGTIAESTREQVTETMNGPDVLDVEQFPTAVFKIKSGTLRGEGKAATVYNLEGDLTLRGKTHPLTIEAEQSQKEGRLRFRGDFTILQSDFGITPYKAALGTVGVADELKIWGDIWVAAREPDRK